MIGDLDKGDGLGGSKMKRLNPSMKLKVKRDTFFLPDPGRGVYFRNNRCSFYMKGLSIAQWVEKLLPMFNGKYTLEALTHGLPDRHRNRVYEIAEVLVHNGFVQDVSKDLPHQLSEQILEKYASQIEFIQNLAGSGEYRFQTYRQKRVLAIGSGSIFVSLISSLLESGLPSFHVYMTNPASTNRKRIKELIKQAKETDPEIEIKEISLAENGTMPRSKLIQPFEAIVYVSEAGNIDELRRLNQICLEEKKLLLPAICLGNIGIAGPLVHHDSPCCFESLWRSLHKTVFKHDWNEADYSPSAGAMLANLIVFELFKQMTAITDFTRHNQCFLLHLDTMEGNWHYFRPHPMVTGGIKAQWVDEHDSRLKKKSEENRAGQSQLIYYLNKLTSPQCGIFHRLEEGTLPQLPLSQCHVQVIDPLSEGPAELLPSVVCAAMTHEAARKEAGLTGIEAYVTRMKSHLIKTLPQRKAVEKSSEEGAWIGFGAGETYAEAVCRGLQTWLEEEWRKHFHAATHMAVPMKLSVLEDKQCSYYLQALTAIKGSPVIAKGEELFGFPVIWVGTGAGWFGGTGFNTTLALRKALEYALMSESHGEQPWVPKLEPSSLIRRGKIKQDLEIPDLENSGHTCLLSSVIDVMKKNGRRIERFEVELEPVLNKKWICIYGVFVREEESL